MPIIYSQSNKRKNDTLKAYTCRLNRDNVDIIICNESIVVEDFLKGLI